MAIRSCSPIGPFSSIGLPRTSMIRPNVSAPTGTEMGAAVFFTDKPRLMPSDDPMAIDLTTPSPSCCCTSSVRPLLSTTSAS